MNPIVTGGQMLGPAIALIWQTAGMVIDVVQQDQSTVKLTDNCTIGDMFATDSISEERICLNI